jgi:hypothetical protein
MEINCRRRWQWRCVTTIVSARVPNYVLFTVSFIMSVKHLVLDSGAFISGSKLDHFGPHTAYITTPRVLAEIRDKQTREILANFPYEITTRSVDPKATAAVTRFAQATGDIAVLSATDLEIIALTVMLETEVHGPARVRAPPVAAAAAATPVKAAPKAAATIHTPFAAAGPALPFNMQV